jgi:hypothetical protein
MGYMRRFYYIMDWEYKSINDPSPEQKRLRYLLHKQILMSDIQLKKTLTLDKCDINYLYPQSFNPNKYNVYLDCDYDSDESLDISDFK